MSKQSYSREIRFNLGLVVCLIILMTLFTTMTSANYVNLIKDDDQYAIKNTASNDKNDYFLIDNEGNTEYVIIDVNGKMFPKKRDFSHTSKTITESDKGLMKMLDASMGNQ